MLKLYNFTVYVLKMPYYNIYHLPFINKYISNWLNVKVVHLYLLTIVDILTIPNHIFFF